MIVAQEAIDSLNEDLERVKLITDPTFESVEGLVSSNLSYIGYSNTTKSLRLSFGAKAIYEYTDVPIEKYIELKDAESKGKYFHSNIKNKYTTTKIFPLPKKED